MLDPKLPRVTSGAWKHETPIYGLLLWALVILGLFSIPLLAYVFSGQSEWDNIHPALNACLNATAAFFLFWGFRAIKKGQRQRHGQCMVAAFGCSTLFLTSYLIRYYISGVHKYPGDDIDRTIYLIILTSHTLLAIVAVPLILTALYLGATGRFEKHKKIAKWTWPIWVYVSLTGVIVYAFLYQLAPRLHS